MSNSSAFFSMACFDVIVSAWVAFLYPPLGALVFACITGILLFSLFATVIPFGLICNVLVLMTLVVLVVRLVLCILDNLLVRCLYKTGKRQPPLPKNDDD